MVNQIPLILVVEDEPQIRRFVVQALELIGWQVVEAINLQGGMSQAATRKPDLVILDLGLPDGNGLTLIQDLRVWSDVPIIVLSARVTEKDKVSALDAGADDYLVKPFGIPELLARIRAHLRRQVVGVNAENSIFTFGEISVDLTRRLVFRNSTEVHVTPTEYRLLTILIKNVGRVLTHRQILVEVWGTNYTERSHYLRIYIARLRQKLEIDPNQPQHFLTETAVGYRLLVE